MQTDEKNEPRVPKHYGFLTLAVSWLANEIGKKMNSLDRDDKDERRALLELEHDVLIALQKYQQFFDKNKENTDGT